LLGKNGSGAPAYARAGWQRGQCADKCNGYELIRAEQTGE